jgi:hypothetical protein
LVTDTADVKDHEVLGVGVDQTLELADHKEATFIRSAWP